MQVPRYTFDADRLAALGRAAILDTPAEPAFDGIVQLASQICQTPVALVSLVANDRQWFKARIGFAACETDLNRSVCAHALIEPDMLVIGDLTQDERSRDNPLVTSDPHIRFYAGVPFHAASGEVLGSLCVIDTLPRPAGLTGPQADGLRHLGRRVTALLEMRQAIVERDALAVAERDAEDRRRGLLHLGDTLREMTMPAEMTRISARLVGQTLNVSRAGFSLLDQNGAYLPGGPDWIAEDCADTGGRPRINDHVDLRRLLLHGETIVIEDVEMDVRTAHAAASLISAGIRSAVNIPVRRYGRTVAVFVVHDRQPRKWSAEILAFLRSVADRLEAAIARVAAEAEQQLLNHELSHRLKKTFAMIQAIARQTLRSVPDQRPVGAFVQRLHALSAAHDVLLQQRWTSAAISDVVSAPLRKGFGSTLIGMGLVGTAGVDVCYLPTGFEAEFNAPLAQVQCY